MRCGDCYGFMGRKIKMPHLDQWSGEGELYVLSEDPNEMSNRFHELACQALKDALLRFIARRPNDIGPLREPVGMA